LTVEPPPLSPDSKQYAYTFPCAEATVWDAMPQATKMLRVMMTFILHLKVFDFVAFLQRGRRKEPVARAEDDQSR